VSESAIAAELPQDASARGSQARAQAAVQPPNIRAVLPGLMLAILLAMLDNVIVGTAMPRIVQELGGVNHLSWVVTAYVLGTTVSTPIWGKLGDLYGRKTVFITSIVLFLAGSALCGMSQNMAQLIGFRAFQGLGAGGLLVGAMAIIGDLVPPRERGKYQGQMAGVMALAMIGGPLVGGFITDHADWRWAFYVNLPLGGIALLVLLFQLKLPKYRTEHRIDWLGAALLSVGIIALVLLTTWGGTRYKWGSWQILGLAAVGFVMLLAFGFVERRAVEPIISLDLFRIRNFSLVAGMGFIVGFAMFGAITFLPLYQQTVQGASATNSGLLLLPMMGGMLVTSIVVGRAITKTGRYKIFPILGGVVLTVGMFLLSRLGADTSRVTSGIYMAVLGVGMGFLMQTTMLIAQNSVEQRDLGVASSAATFFRSIGGSFGVAMFGAIFSHRLNGYLADKLGPAQAAKMGSGGSSLSIGPTTLAKMPANIRGYVIHAIAHATSGVFIWAVAIAVIVPILALFIKEVTLRGSDQAPAPAGAAVEITEPAVSI
jgi:EmrB/QacA subfamily drug resistance transporter